MDGVDVLVGGGGEGCDDEGGGVVLEGDVENGGVVISWMRGVVFIPLPFSSSGSWMGVLHSELVQHLLI